MKKSELYIVIAMFAIIFFASFSIDKTKYTGFVAYTDNNLCGATVSETSTLSSSILCDDLAPATSGPNLNSAGISFDCQANTIEGGNADFGIKVSAENIIIKRCPITTFAYDLNISSNNTSVIDSRLSIATKDVWLGPDVNATFYNVTFTQANAQVTGTASNLFLKYPVKILVNFSNNGTVIDGATVSFIHSNLAFASQDSGTTNSSGIVLFNITKTVVQSAGALTDFDYGVYANSTAGNGINTSLKIPAQPAPYFAYIQITPTAADTTYPQFTDLWDDNATLTDSGTGHFNVSVSYTNGTVWLQINSTNVSSANLSQWVYNTTHGFTTNGTYSYIWWAYGNGTSNNLNSSATITRVYQVNVTSDSTPPTITINSPLNISYTNTTSVFNATINENGTCIYSLNSGANISMTNNDNRTFTAENSSMLQGSHTARFYCNDTTGNLNTTSITYFIDSTSPNVTIVTPTNITYTTNSYDINFSISEVIFL